MRKAICSALAMIVVTASLAACSGNGGNAGGAETAKPSNNAGASTNAPAQEEVIDPFAKFEQVTEVSIGRAIDPNYKFDGSDTPEDNVYTRWLKDKYNIVVKHAWEAAQGNDYQQKVSLAISSNDLPDAMVVNETQLRQMVRPASWQT